MRKMRSITESNLIAVEIVSFLGSWAQSKTKFGGERRPGASQSCKLISTQMQYFIKFKEVVKSVILLWSTVKLKK